MTENEQAVREALAARYTVGDEFGSAYPLVNPDGPKALALLDAKDAEIRSLEAANASTSQREFEALKQRNTALSRAEQAEAHTHKLNEQLDRRQDLLDAAEAALAERDAAIVEAVRRADEMDAPTHRWAAKHFSEPLRRFILPAKPAVDPLVAVLEAAGYAVFPEDLERVRAAIERAGGTIAFGGDK